MVHRFLNSKLDEWGYFTLTIASGTRYLLYGSKICHTSNPKCRFSLQSSTGSKKHLAEEAALLSVSPTGSCASTKCPPVQAHALAAEHVLTATRLTAVKSPFLSWWSLTTFSKWAAFIVATSCTGTTEPSVSPQEALPLQNSLLVRIPATLMEGCPCNPGARQMVPRG